MKGFRLNPNLDYVNRIIIGIDKKNGHCPCRVNMDESTLCPCDDFVTNGNCKCSLFVKIEK